MPSITHQFVSPLPDGSDPSLVDASEWNQPHTINVDGVLIGNSSPDISGVAAINRLQLLRRSVTNTSYEFVTPYIFSSADFKFTPVSSAVNLTAGVAATIPLGSTIPGISAASVGKHFLRIVDSNPALSETVLLSAGTSSTQLVFTPVNSHIPSGYTINSASDGIQEAVNSIGVGEGGTVWLPAGRIDLYQRVTIPGTPTINIRGVGAPGSNVYLHSSMTNADAFFCDNATGLVGFYDFTILGHANHSGGYGIHLKTSTAAGPTLSNITIYDTYGGLYLEGVDNVQVVNFVYIQNSPTSNPNATYGMRIGTNSSQINCIGGRIDSPQVDDPAILDYGIMIEGADGLTFTGFHVRCNVGVQIDGSAGGQIGSVFFTGNIIDSCRTNGVVVTGHSAASLLENIKFANNHIISGQLNSSVPFKATGDITKTMGLSLVGNVISYGFGNNIELTNVWGAILSGNDIRSGGRSGAANSCGVLINGGKEININGGIIGNQDTGIYNTQDYGLSLLGNISSLCIDGVTLRGNTLAPILNNATITESLIGVNLGISDQMPFIASATTVTVPNLAQNVVMSGNAHITNFNPAIGSGQTVNIISVGTFRFHTGGNIGAAFGPVSSGQLIRGVYNAGSDNKWYFQ